MNKKDSELLAERYEQIRHHDLLSEGVADALKNKLIDWAMSTVALAIKQFAPDVYRQLQQVGSKEELIRMIKPYMQQPITETYDDFLEPHKMYVPPKSNLMKGGSEGFSPEEMKSLVKRPSKEAMPEETPQSTEKIKSAVQKFKDIVKEAGVTLPKVLRGIGVVIATIAVIPIFMNPVGVLIGLLYLKTRQK